MKTITISCNHVIVSPAGWQLCNSVKKKKNYLKTYFKCTNKINILCGDVVRCCVMSALYVVVSFLWCVLLCRVCVVYCCVVSVLCIIVSILRRKIDAAVSSWRKSGGGASRHCNPMYFYIDVKAGFIYVSLPRQSKSPVLSRYTGSD